MNSRVLPKPRPKLYVASTVQQGERGKLTSVQQLIAFNFMQHLPDIAWAVDEEGHLLNANQAFYRAFRLEEKRAINQFIISLVPPELSSRLTIQHKSVFENGQSLRTDVRVTQPNDTVLTYHVHLFPLPAVAGRRVLAGIATVSTEVGDRRVNLVKQGRLAQPELITRVLHAERTRIGHELHDNVNQILSSAALYLDSLKPVDDQQHLIKGKGREYILLAIEEIRRLSGNLVTPELDTRQFHYKINTLIDDVRTNTGLDLTYTSSFCADRVSPANRLAIFRIIQEQVKNILTHSKAANANISLLQAGTNLQLSITDDGQGFDTKKSTDGVGLASIRNRVSECSGTMQLLSSPGAGCKLHVELPLGKTS